MVDAIAGPGVVGAGSTRQKGLTAELLVGVRVAEDVDSKEVHCGSNAEAIEEAIVIRKSAAGIAANDAGNMGPVTSAPAAITARLLGRITRIAAETANDSGADIRMVVIYAGISNGPGHSGPVHPQISQVREVPPSPAPLEGGCRRRSG